MWNVFRIGDRVKVLIRAKLKWLLCDPLLGSEAEKVEHFLIPEDHPEREKPRAMTGAKHRIPQEPTR